MSIAAAQVDLSLLRPVSPQGEVATNWCGNVEAIETSGLRARRPAGVLHSLTELRHRLVDHHDSSLSGEEIIHLLLATVLDEPTAKRLAQVCIQRFGSIGALFAARDDHLNSAFEGEIEPVTLIRCVRRVLQELLREPLEQRPILNDLQKLYDYLRLTLANETHEVVRLLFLNGRNALLKDELHARGTINHTPVYPREIVKRVIEVNASALIIAHNHPSGDPSPSKEDIAMTALLKRVLMDIGVTLHDHVVVGQFKCESMRALSLI